MRKLMMKIRLKFVKKQWRMKKKQTFRQHALSTYRSVWRNGRISTGFSVARGSGWARSGSAPPRSCHVAWQRDFVDNGCGDCYGCSPCDRIFYGWGDIDVVEASQATRPKTSLQSGISKVKKLHQWDYLLWVSYYKDWKHDMNLEF